MKTNKIYAGDNTFILHTKAVLDKMMSEKMDIRARVVFNDLIRGSEKHTIANYDISDGTPQEQIGSFNIASRNQVTNKKGSWTKFDPDADRAKRVENSDWSDEDILGHEMKHGFNRKYGIQNFNLTEDTKDGVPLEEIDAVNFQNVIRHSLNLPERTKYAGIDIFKYIVITLNYVLPYTTKRKE